MGRVWPRHGHRSRPLNSVVRRHVEAGTQTFLVLLAIAAVFSIALFVTGGVIARSVAKQYPKLPAVAPLSWWEIALMCLAALAMAIGTIEANANPYGAIGAWVRERGYWPFLAICAVPAVVIRAILLDLGFGPSGNRRRERDERDV